MTAMRSKQRQKVANIVTVPSTFAGWNAKDNVDLMAPQYAITMDNWIPRESYCQLRNGFILRATLGYPAKTMFPYNVAGNEKLLAAAGGAILDVNLGGGANTELSSGNSDDIWNYQQYKQRIFAVNGADTPFVYDGAAVSATGFSGSGLSLNDLSNLTIFSNRLFFSEKDTLNFWYTTNAGNITGTLESYDLSSYSEKGGQILCLETWTQEDDQLVIITTEGEVFIFSGTNPSDASNWYLRGRFLIPKPLNSRSVQKIAGDLFVITQQGYFPLSRILAADGANKALAFSDKIDGAVKDLESRFSDFGWQIKFYSKGSFLIVNTPQKSGGGFYQHVMNTTMGAWCRWTGLQANCFEVFEDNLYFAGTDGSIYQADFGSTDNGAAISGYVQQAFNNFESLSLKKFNEVSPLISTELDLSMTLSFAVDFKTPQNISVSSSGGSIGGAVWDVAAWDEEYWGDSEESIQRRILVAADLGYKCSWGIRTSTTQGNIKWYSTMISFEQAQGIK